MNYSHVKILEHFTGALLGAFVGDALGMPFEGSRPFAFDGRMCAGRFPAGCYTDDTEMTIGLAEALVDGKGTFAPQHAAARFLDNFHPERGYGGRIYGLMSRLANGARWDTVASDSWGNGAAMRVAPVGAFFFDRPRECSKAARQQASITHTHPLGVAGAVAQAAGVALAAQAGISGKKIVPADFADTVASAVQEISSEMAGELRMVKNLKHGCSAREILQYFPCDVSAIGAVPAAMAAFLMTSAFKDALILAVSCGRDTDTVGAMTGALAGACYGATAIPVEWTDVLENGPKGRDYVIELANKLAELK